MQKKTTDLYAEENNRSVCRREEKRWVLSFDSKDETEDAYLTESGSEFQITYYINISRELVHFQVSSAMLLYVHRDNKDCWGRGAQDVHLDFHTASNSDWFNVSVQLWILPQV